jgi:hypothetical protein
MNRADFPISSFVATECVLVETRFRSSCSINVTDTFAEAEFAGRTRAAQGVAAGRTLSEQDVA